MIDFVSATNTSGETLVMPLATPETSGFAVAKVEGIGPVDASVTTSTFAGRDGAVDTGTRVGVRTIILTLVYRPDWSKGETIESLRHKTYRHFPMKERVKFRIKADERDVMIEGIVESNSIDIFSSQEMSKISILCPDPYFRQSFGMDLGNAISFSAVTPNFSFPFENTPVDQQVIEFSIEDLRTETPVEYKGDVESGAKFTINILKRCEKVTITHLGMDVGTYVPPENTVYLDLDSQYLNRVNYLLPKPFLAGDQITVNTELGNRSIEFLRGDKSYNGMPLSSIYGAWPLMYPGVNRLGFKVTGGDMYSVRCSVVIDPRYMGV